MEEPTSKTPTLPGFTRASSATLGAVPTALCPGPLAGIDEQDKVRTIYDGSVGGANAKIQQNTKERTTAPTVLDCVHAIHWLHAARHTEASTRPRLAQEPLALSEQGAWTTHSPSGSGPPRTANGSC